MKARILLSLLCLTACQTVAGRLPAASTPLVLAEKGIRGQLVQPGDWLGEKLEFAPYDGLRKDVEVQLGLTPGNCTHSGLKNRCEAHITILTPPEWQILTGSISSQEILNLAQKLDVGHADFKVVCVGQGVSGAMKTYFVVVDSPALLNFRQQLATLAGSPAAFQANDFHPHVTLGFTVRDLFIQDGVVKDETSCLMPLDLR